MLRAIAWTCGLTLAFLSDAPTLEPVGRLQDPAIREASGIVQSRKHAGVFWVHNDSGNPAMLFAVKRDGTLIRSYRVEAANIDWEDIAIDDSGHLYLGDIGNNTLKLPRRAIHKLDEPDPGLPDDAPLKLVSSTYYKYADADRFDAESLFVRETQAFVIAKRKDGKNAEVHRLSLEPPAPLLRPTTPERVGTLDQCQEPATGADLSSDGKRLAVVTNSAARVYEGGVDQKWTLVATVKFSEKDVEAICWDGLDLILASEDRSIYRISEAAWKATTTAAKGRAR